MRSPGELRKILRLAEHGVLDAISKRCHCGEPVRAHGLCQKHRSQALNRINSRRNGFAYACAVAEEARAAMKAGPSALRGMAFLEGQALAAVYLGKAPV